MKAHKRRKRASILEDYKCNIVVSVILGLLIVLLCISLCSLIVSSIDVPLKVITFLNSINLGVGSYFSGYFSAIKRQKSGIFSGTLCGLLLFSTLLIIGSILNIKGGLLSKLCKLIISVVCSAIGGIKSANCHNV